MLRLMLVICLVVGACVDVSLGTLCWVALGGATVAQMTAAVLARDAKK